MQTNELADGLWAVDGPVSIDLGVIPYPTRMTIARLPDGGLWVASPVPTSFAGLSKLVELGPVRHLVSPTPRHHWRLESWHTLFPEAELWACARGPFTLGDRRLPTTQLDDEPPVGWAHTFDQAIYRARGFEETTFLHRQSGTLLVEDVLQSHTARPGQPVVNTVIAAGGVREPGGVPRDVRLVTPRANRAWAQRVMAWDFDRIVMAHGPVIENGGKAYFARAFDWLLH